MRLSYRITDNVTATVWINGDLISSYAITGNVPVIHVERLTEVVDGVNINYEFETPGMHCTKAEVELLTDESGRHYFTPMFMEKFKCVQTSYNSPNNRPKNWIAKIDLDQKIYLDTYIRYSMKEFSDILNSDNGIEDTDFVMACLHDGIDNVRFEMNFMRYDNFAASLGIGLCSSDDRIVSIGKIRDLFGTEQRRSYKLIDNYKIDIEPVERTLNGHMLAGRDYYISDFLSMCRSGIIKILPSVGDPSVDHSEEYFRERKLDWFNASYK